EAKERLDALREALSGDVETSRALLKLMFPMGITAMPVELPNDRPNGRRTMKRYCLSGTSVGNWPLLLLEAANVPNPPENVASPARANRREPFVVPQDIVAIFDAGGAAVEAPQLVA